MEKRKVFDIDGTICSIESPENYCNAKPFDDMIKQINKLYDEGNIIYFFTARHMLHERTTKEWFKKHGVKYHNIFFGKPLGDYYVDDKGMTPTEFLKMMINKDKKEQEGIKFVKKVWGSEIWITNSELYCGKILNLKKGYFCSFHSHKIKEETFYILEGKVLMKINKQERVMSEGDVVHILPGVYHRFTGWEDSRIIEISTQHFEDDSYRLDKSGKV